MKTETDNTSNILNAIMKRYGSLTDLYESMRECTDTVLVNLEEDSGIDMNEIEDYIMQTINGEQR